MLRVLSCLLLAVLINHEAIAQISDYSEVNVSPSLAYENLNLTIEPDTSDSTLKGVATWQVRLIDEKPDSLSLNLFKGVVNSVRIDEQSVTFSYLYDRLTLELPESILVDSLFKIEINYSSDPVVGLHFQDNGYLAAEVIYSQRFSLPPFE